MTTAASSAPTRSTNAPRRRGDETRAKIIDETVRCIVEEGFPAATAKHVAERLRKGLLHIWAETMQQLLDAPRQFRVAGNLDHARRRKGPEAELH